MIRKNGEVNCLGFVYSRLGLHNKDEWLWTDDYQEIKKDFEDAFQKDADIIVIMTESKKPYLIHYALLYPADKRYVLQRAGPGAPITCVSLKSISDHYSWHFKLKFLKLKENKKIKPSFIV